MKVEQIYTGCLAAAAYYIESNGEVAIIDPLRDPKPYLERANEAGAKIKYVMETHFHADFVSGHLDLAKATGAKIVFGPNAETGFEAYIAKDGEILELGKVKIKVLHTPGHTMESTSYLLIDEHGKNNAIFTGDTLFIGDVGRPDLAVKSNLTKEDLAAHLFDSLRNKIMPLEDELIVYPGHGAGSACGKMMSKETSDTLGHQKKFNYALRADMTKAEFIKAVTEGLTPPPQYFPKNVAMNKMGYESFDEVMEKGNIPLSIEEFIRVAENTDALIVDTRHQSEFAKGFIPGSIFIGVDGSFAPWVGALITDIKQPILVIADEGMEEEVVMRFSRVGYDNTLGYLKGGVNAWKDSGREVDTLDEVSVVELEHLYHSNPDLKVLDVRKAGEYEAGHAEGAINLPLDILNKNMNKVERESKYYIHCASGYRSVIAASILKSRGFTEMVNVKGGYKEMAQTKIPVATGSEISI